jgi:hypothetical protein
MLHLIGMRSVAPVRGRRTAPADGVVDHGGRDGDGTRAESPRSDDAGRDADLFTSVDRRNEA